MDLLKKKLRGATLVESLVAMVIVLLCIGIASLIYVNVIASNNSRIRLRAEMMLNELAYKTKLERTFIDEELLSTEFVIHKKIVKVEYASNLYALVLKAIDKKGTVLAEQKEMIIQ